MIITREYFDKVFAKVKFLIEYIICPSRHINYIIIYAKVNLLHKTDT